MFMKLTSISALAAFFVAGLMTTGCKKKNSEPVAAPPVKVTVMAVSPETYGTASSYSGTVSSANSSTVSFSVPGTISDLYVSEGQQVSKGALLGKLKDGDYVNANNISHAQLAEAEDAYNRLKKLHDSNSLPDIKWVDIQQKLEQAKNAAEISARALADTKLYAPISGVVSRKLADVGQNVAPIQPIYEIVTTGDLTIDVSVPENEIERFSLGQKAQIDFNVASVGTLEGTVTEKSVVADPLTRTYKVKVSLPKTGGKILPGMVGTVRFETAESDGISTSKSILLPSQAVVLGDDNRTFVWIVKGGKAERRFVTANELVANGVAIESGLTAGDTVIVGGMQKVGTGSIVDPVVAP